MKFFLLIVLGVLASVSVFAASITVNPLTVVFASAKTAKQAPHEQALVTARFSDIKIYNTGSEKAYVNVQLAKVQHPGTVEKALEPLASNPSIFGLVVTPTKLIIPQGQSRRVRVMRLVRNNDEDVVYQLNIAPVKGSLQPVHNEKKEVVAGVRVIVGYNVAVRVLPKDPQAHLQFTREGKSLLLKNTGNSSLLLTKGKQCDAAGEHCQSLPVKRLYAGNSWKQTLPYDTPVSYQQTFLNQNTAVTIN